MTTEQRDGGAETDGEVHGRATTLPARPAPHPTGEPFRRLRWALRATGRTLIALGTLILAFVAYQLWGTNLAEARHQRELKAQFERLLATPAPPATTVAPREGAAPPVAPSTTLAPAPPPAPTGSAVAAIRIPRIGVDKVVVEGVGVEDLKKGPGHYPETPLPGQPGNAAIAGHRTTYGAPFNRIDELEPGDPILVTTRQGSFRYEVTGTRIVRPSETSVLDPTDDNRLTLTSCNPKFSARQRIVVTARLVGPAAPAPPPTTPPATAETPEAPVAGPPAGPAGGGAPAPAGAAAGLDAGLSGEAASRTPTVLWGAATALVALAIWGAGRRWRRWVAWLLGAPVFCVVLFVFFENVSRLLPANI
jgi:sortase A